MKKTKNKKLKTSLLIEAQQRLYQISHPLIGISGNLAAGKSTLLNYFAIDGYFTLSADRLVDQVYQQPPTLNYLKKINPLFVREGKPYKKAIRQAFLQDPQIQKDLEWYLHESLQDLFLEALQTLPPGDVVVYEIPLLFEKNLEDKFDLTLVVSCPLEKRREFFMKRTGQGPQVFNKINQLQLPEKEKISRAQFVIRNEKMKEDYERFLKEVMEETPPSP